MWIYVIVCHFAQRKNYICQCATVVFCLYDFKLNFPIVLFFFLLFFFSSFSAKSQHRTVFLRQLLMCGSFCGAKQENLNWRWVHAIAKCFSCLNVEWQPVMVAAHVCLHGASVQAVHLSYISAQLCLEQSCCTPCRVTRRCLFWSVAYRCHCHHCRGHHVTEASCL